MTHVVSDMLGVSGRAILKALIAGEMTVRPLQELHAALRKPGP